MKQENDLLANQLKGASTEMSQPVILNATEVDNAVLKRLINEIKVDKDNTLTAYNRTHNRHNRGR